MAKTGKKAVYTNSSKKYTHTKNGSSKTDKSNTRPSEKKSNGRKGRGTCCKTFFFLFITVAVAGVAVLYTNNEYQEKSIDMVNGMVKTALEKYESDIKPLIAKAWSSMFQTAHEKKSRDPFKEHYTKDEERKKQNAEKKKAEEDARRKLEAERKLQEAEKKRKEEIRKQQEELKRQEEQKKEAEEQRKKAEAEKRKKEEEETKKKEEEEKKKREEAQRKKREEDEKKKQEAERKRKEEEKRNREEAERRKREEAERLKREEAERKKKEEAEKKKREAEEKKRLEAEKKKTEEAEKNKREEAERKKKEEEENMRLEEEKKKKEADRKKREEEEVRRVEAEKKKKEEAERKKRKEEEKRRLEEEKKKRDESERKKREEEEKKDEAERKYREEEEKRRLEEEKKKKDEAERKKREEEEKRRLEKEKKKKDEAEKKKREEEEKRRLEEEKKKKDEAERKKREEEEKRRLEEEKKKKDEAERKKREEEEKRRLEEEKKKKDEVERKKREEEEKRRLEEEKKKKDQVERKKREEEEKRRLAEEKEKKVEAERKKREEEEKRRLEEEKKKKDEAERKKSEGEEKKRLEEEKEKKDGAEKKKREVDEKKKLEEEKKEGERMKKEEEKRKSQQKDIYDKTSITNEADFQIRSQLDDLDNKLHMVSHQALLGMYDKILEKFPRSPRANFMKAEILNLMAEEQRSNKVLDEAITQYQVVLDLSNVPDDLLIKCGKILAERQNFRGFSAKSMKTLRFLSDRFPNNIELKNKLGVAYLIANQNEEARRIFKQVLDLDPNNGFAKVHLGFIYKVIDNEIENAVPLLTEGIASEEEGTRDGRFYFHLGDALQRLNQTENAYKIYKAGAENGLFLSVYQRSLYNINTLTGKPWWTLEETGYQNYFKLLLDNWKTIRDEGLAQLDAKTGGFVPEQENLRETGDWKQFVLWKRGQKEKENCAKTPKTCELIDQIPPAKTCKRGQVKFSVIHPGAHIWPHCGPTNCRLRAHLGLKVPPGIKIRVGQQTRTWEEGKFIVFDDSFEHEVWHDGKELRLVLIVDVWHPELTEEQMRNLSPI